MNIVDFLEERIAEEESALAHADTDGDTPSASLAAKMLAECAQKRAIIDYWKRRAADAGVDSPSEDRRGACPDAVAMLSILAAAYRTHPDYPTGWRRVAA